jgi:hypothetical protein
VSFPQPPAPADGDDLAYLAQLAEYISAGAQVVRAARDARRDAVARLRAAGVPAVRIAAAAHLDDSYVARLAQGRAR